MAGYKNLEIVQDFQKYVKDKKTSSRAYYKYFLSRLLKMFQYKNLPDTIPHEIFDRYLFEFGIACITEVEGKLYVFSGNLGGPQDVYYRPTEFIIANPHIKKDGDIFSANIPVFETNESTVGQPRGVLMRNDPEWIGLHPLIARYSYLMAENILTLRTADVMLRIIALLTAKTDNERAGALEYLKSMEEGNLAIIGESSFHEGINLQSPPSNNGSYLTQFIEYQQYLKGSFFNEVGLCANYNMKREAIGKGESTLDSDALLPLCDIMLLSRKEDLAKVNEMFGTNIEVEFSSSWLENRIESLSTLKTLGQPTPNFQNLGQPTVGTGGADASDAQSTPEEVPKPEAGVGAGPEAGPGAGPGAGPETGAETGAETEPDNPESRINDLSVDENLTKIYEDIVNDDDDEVVVNHVGGDDDENSDGTAPDDSSDIS